MRKRRRWAVALATLALAGFVLSDAPARLLVVEDETAATDAAVVLAGDVDYERTATAASLYRRGQVRLVILTGGEWGPGDSATSLRDQAIALGVPAEKIRMETVSASTRGALLAVQPLLVREGVRSVTLVTSPYHQLRAWLVARRAWPGITIHNRPASPSFWAPRNWWLTAGSRKIVLSEYGKLGYYAIRGWL